MTKRRWADSSQTDIKGGCGEFGSRSHHTLLQGIVKKIGNSLKSQLSGIRSFLANRVLYRKHLQPGNRRSAVWRFAKLFFAPGVPRGLLMQLWGAALNGRTSTKDRICRYRCRMFPCAIHTTNSHSQTTALAVLEQGWPTASAEFLISTTSQLPTWSMFIAASTLKMHQKYTTSRIELAKYSCH